MRGGLRNQNLVGWCLLIGAVAVAAAFVLWLQRGGLFAWDEFNWLEEAGFESLGGLLHPYGGHLIIVPYLIYKAVLNLFGVSFAAFSVIEVAMLSAAAILVYIYAKRRIGPLLGLAPAIILLFLGSSWEVLLEPVIGIQFLCAIVPGLAAIVLLERNDRGGDIAACALLLLSAAGFSESVAFLLGAAVFVALGSDRWRRAWVVAIPIVALFGWHVWAAQFESTHIIKSNIPLLPAYYADAIPAYAYSILGLGQMISPGPWTIIRLERYELGLLSEAVVFSIFVLIVAGVGIWLARRRGPIPRTFWTAVAMLVGLMTELGVIFMGGKSPAEVRYLYAGALLLMLLAVEVLRGLKTTRTTLFVAAALTFAAVFGNLARFHEARQELDLYQKEARAAITVVELAGKKGDQEFLPSVDAPEYAPGRMFLFASGAWLALVDRYGSSTAESLSHLQGQAESIREKADGVAVKSLGLQLEPSAAPAAGCHTVQGAAPLEVTLPPGGAVLESKLSSAVSIGRWADVPLIPLGELSAGAPALLRIPRDHAAGIPWRVGLAAGESLRICPPSPKGPST